MNRDLSRRPAGGRTASRCSAVRGFAILCVAWVSAYSLTHAQQPPAGGAAEEAQPSGEEPQAAGPPPVVQVGTGDAVEIPVTVVAPIEGVMLPGGAETTPPSALGADLTQPSGAAALPGVGDQQPTPGWPMQPGTVVPGAGSISSLTGQSGPSGNAQKPAASPPPPPTNSNGAAAGPPAAAPDWLYDEFARSQGAARTPAAAPASPSSEPALSRPQVIAPYRPAPRKRTRRAPLPSAQRIEEVAEKSAKPALYVLGFLLLGAAVSLHLRERGPSVEALCAAGDVESLLALLHTDSAAHGQRAREALLTLLPELTREQKVDDLVAALRADDSGIRQRAAEALASVTVPAATGALANAVRDYTERLPDDLRVQMLEWLAVRDDAETTEVLLDGLHDRSATLREVAYAHLYARVQSLGDQHQTAQLTRIMRRGDADLRGAAIAALGQLGLPEAAEPLGELAADYSSPPETRCLAVRALRCLPGEGARAALHGRLVDFFPTVRQCASEVLSQPAPATAEGLDQAREQATKRLHAALAAHLEGRRTTTPEGDSLRWEDEAQELGQRLHEAAGRDLVYAVFHEVDRRLRASHGRSPRMLRLQWQQQHLL